MFDDMNDMEILTRMEKHYGPLSKKLTVYTTDAIDKLEGELVTLLQQYRQKMSVKTPIPRIRMWIEENSVKFLFFDRSTGRRVILGEWLEGKHGYYEH
jgi:hypothetical protein